MQLPENRIGISDIEDHRECPRRAQFKMRRHVEGEAPESMGPSNAYGTIIHDVFHAIEHEDLTDDEAIQRAFDEHGKWLEPDDLDLLREDVEKYHEREYTGVRLVGSEMEIHVPLLVHEGRTIHYRARIDRLYQMIANPAVFIHIDYKSSKWRKSRAEVDRDVQMWSYNWSLHEYFPEIESLEQRYDQLRFGVEPTRKTAAQRQKIKDWLVKQVTAVLRDETGEPKFNRWCPWCPIMESCAVVERLSTYARAEIGAIAPMDKQGRKNVVKLDPDLFEVYVEELETVGTARKVLERFEESVKRALKDMPGDRRANLGYKLREKSVSVFPPEAVAAVHEELGDQFYEVVSLSKTRVEEAFAGDPERTERILQMADKVRQAAQVVKG